MPRISRRTRASYLRSFTFGVEDSLVSTVGLLSGVAVADVGRSTLLLTGVVLIFVEAFSMAVGNLLSENAAEEYLKRSEQPIGASVGMGALMFISYFVSGFVPLLPYVLLSSGTAFWTSISASIVALFALGVFNAGLEHQKASRKLFHGFQMSAIGGLAIAVGVIVGRVVHGFGG